MRVFITGVTGFIGRHLAERLAALGHSVAGSTTAGADAGSDFAELHRLRLGDDARGAFDRADCVIHAAWSLDPDHERKNLEGTIAWHDQARKAGVARQIFISSFSAHPSARTAYGRAKYAAEQALEGEASMVRPGLVIGPGGLFARMSALVDRAPVVPCIAGTGAFPVIAIDDLCQALSVLATGSGNVGADLYNEEPVTLKALLRETAAALKKRRLFVPVPYSIAAAGAWMLDRLPLHIGLSLENVRGLRANSEARMKSDLLKYVPSPMSLGEALRRALQS